MINSLTESTAVTVMSTVAFFLKTCVSAVVTHVMVDVGRLSTSRTRKDESPRGSHDEGSTEVMFEL